MTYKVNSRCIWLCCMLLGIISFPICWYGTLRTTPLRISKETTYILEPLTPNGKLIDYFKALEDKLYPPEMKTDDNGYRLIVRAFGVKTEDPSYPAYQQQIYEKLGLDPNIKPTQKIENPLAIINHYEKDHPEETHKGKIMSQFGRSAMWTLDEYPMLKEWLEENSTGLDLLAEAVRQPVFRTPYIRRSKKKSIMQSPFLFSETRVYRNWANAASARAKYRIGIGDIDGAIDDIITIHHLGRHYAKQGFLISWFVGIALEKVSYAIGIGSNSDFPPTKEQIERLAKEINALPPRVTWKEVAETERYHDLASLQNIYWDNSPLAPEEPLPYAFHVLFRKMNQALDINIAMEQRNKDYDALLALSDSDLEKVPDEIRKEPSWDPLPYLFKRSRTHRLMDIFFLSVPAITKSVNKAAQREQCCENVQRLTLALLLYEKDHGTLPEGDWREAVKPYLGENPEQYFRCPSCDLAEGETTYAMVDGVPNVVSSPYQILLVEAVPPQQLGEGNGRIPFEKAVMLREDHPVPSGHAGLGSNHVGRIIVGCRNGEVRTLSKNIDQEELRSLLDGSATKLP